MIGFHLMCDRVATFDSLQQQLARTVHQIVITESNCNQLRDFWQDYKRVWGSLTAFLMGLKIPSGASKLTMWTLNITVFVSFHSQSTGRMRPGTSRYAALSILRARRGCLPRRLPESLRSFKLKRSRESDLSHVKQSLSVSVASAIVLISTANADPLYSEGRNPILRDFCIY